MKSFFPALICSVMAVAQPTGSAQWVIAGHDLNNSRNQPAEHKLSVANIANLTPRWTFTSGSDVSATPTVVGDRVYFPDWSGNIYAVNRADGSLVWSHQISEYNTQPRSVSRVSPAIDGDNLIIGDLINFKEPHAGANVIAINRNTGAMEWITQVENNPAAIITGSPVIANGIIYVGVTSMEENLADDAAYQCCSFRGSVVALDEKKGTMVWKTYVVPDNGGQTDQYSGGGVWQPPAIDLRRGSLYIGTGNNYNVPAAAKACLASATLSGQTSCFAPDDYFDSAMSLDLRTGKIIWGKRLQGFDVWTVACMNNHNPMNCPLPMSPDYDFGGSGPNLLPGMVGFGQKSGMYWALDPITGNVMWTSVVGPGSTGGGIEWGTASDGTRIYAAIANQGRKKYPLVDGTTITWGAWSALDPATGRILWQTADPDQQMALGSVSVANGIVYAPSTSGNLYAFDAATGVILWSFQSGGTTVDGPSIAGGMIFWGTGYAHLGTGIGNNKVYAFGIKQ